MQDLQPAFVYRGWKRQIIRTFNFLSDKNYCYPRGDCWWFCPTMGGAGVSTAECAVCAPRRGGEWRRCGRGATPPQAGCRSPRRRVSATLTPWAGAPHCARLPTRSAHTRQNSLILHLHLTGTCYFARLTHAAHWITAIVNFTAPNPRCHERVPGFFAACLCLISTRHSLTTFLIGMHRITVPFAFSGSFNTPAANLNC
jgi:hypothetical protein